MKSKIITIILSIISNIQIMAQERTVENRPYTDLRPFHFGILVGTHLQDIEFNNAGTISYTNAEGIEEQGCVTVDQDRWDPGFTVGVLGEFRLNTYFQLRIAPAMYFGTRHLSYYNLQDEGAADLLHKGTTDLQDKETSSLQANDASGISNVEKQELKTAYISCSFDLIFAAQRFNNHRPYMMAGINPMLNLSGKSDDYIKLKKTDIFLELGVGCDFYLPFFKLRPELKFMYGLTDTYDKNHIKEVKDKNLLPYTMAANKARTKMIALTFYFE